MANEGNQNQADESRTHELARACLQIVHEQPQSIEGWVGNRVYLKPNKIRLTKKDVFLQDGMSAIQLPAFAYDENGLFLQCSREDAEREAQDHFDRPGEALIEALGHSAAAGVTIECPPLAIYEGYQAVEAWKEAAQEYNAGCEARDRRGN